MELVADYNLDRAYYLSKANLVADSLSRRCTYLAIRWAEKNLGQYEEHWI